MMQQLDVYLWNQKIGTLVPQTNGKACFSFDPDFVKGELDPFPLRASIHSTSVQKGFPVYAEGDARDFKGVPSFIADSLPDRWGTQVLNDWLEVHKKSRDISPLERLSYMARRGMGALEYLPTVAEYMEQPFKIEVSTLYELAREIQFSTKKQHSTSSGLETLFRVGTSAGGRHPKAVICYNPDTKECYSGQVPIMKDGFKPMIVKFDERGKVPYTRFEYI